MTYKIWEKDCALFTALRPVLDAKKKKDRPRLDQELEELCGDKD